MERIKCFWIEPTGRTFYYRTAFSEAVCTDGYRHRANTEATLDEWPPNSLGPDKCECGYAFTDEERRGSGGSFREYRRTDTGEILTEGGRSNWPVGAMWDGDWLKHDGIENPSDKPRAWHLGVDGRILMVRTPGGDWIIDSRCSNCGLPDDNEHRCWVRHGVPPDITVDKNGLTCQAGAGSIQCGSYHGFLRNGYLEEC